eukprot:g21009.t2
MTEPAKEVVLPDAKDFIVVKNTFIDLDDGPRTRTNANECSPCELKKPSVEADLPGGGRGTPLNGSEPIQEDEETEGTEDLPEEAPAPVPVPGVDAPPPMPELYRVVTYDAWERQPEWSWGHEPKSISPRPAEQPQALASGYQQPPAPTVSGPPGGFPMPIPGSAMVMLPVGPMMVPMPDDMAPADTFARWPAGIPAPPTEAPAVELKEKAVTPVPDKEPVVMPPVARIPEPRAPVLQRAFSVNSAIFRIHWTVDAKVLKSSDREKVSPPFEVHREWQSTVEELLQRVNHSVDQAERSRDHFAGEGQGVEQEFSREILGNNLKMLNEEEKNLQRRPSIFNERRWPLKKLVSEALKEASRSRASGRPLRGLRKVAEHIVAAHWFEYVTGLIIFANLITVGIELEMTLTVPEFQKAVWPQVAERIFLFIYFVELVLRSFAGGMQNLKERWPCGSIGRSDVAPSESPFKSSSTQM